MTERDLSEFEQLRALQKLDEEMDAIDAELDGLEVTKEAFIQEFGENPYGEVTLRSVKDDTDG